jgi:hypothetical protein
MLLPVTEGQGRRPSGWRLFGQAVGFIGFMLPTVSSRGRKVFLDNMNAHTMSA